VCVCERDSRKRLERKVNVSGNGKENRGRTGDSVEGSPDWFDVLWRTTAVVFLLLDKLRTGKRSAVDEIHASGRWYGVRDGMAEEPAVKGRLRVTFCRWRSTLPVRKRLSHGHRLFPPTPSRRAAIAIAVRHVLASYLISPSGSHSIYSPSFQKNPNHHLKRMQAPHSHVRPVYGDI
jgi:hypothetical protein